MIWWLGQIQLQRKSSNPSRLEKPLNNALRKRKTLFRKKKKEEEHKKPSFNRPHQVNRNCSGCPRLKSRGGRKTKWWTDFHRSRRSSWGRSEACPSAYWPLCLRLSARTALLDGFASRSSTWRSTSFLSNRRRASSWTSRRPKSMWTTLNLRWLKAVASLLSDLTD